MEIGMYAIADSNNEFLLILIGDLCSRVHVGVAKKFNESASFRRNESDLDRSSVFIDVAELQNQEVTRAPVIGKRTSINIMQSTSDRAVSNAYIGLEITDISAEYFDITVLGFYRNVF